MTESKKTILAIHAHPDDTEIFCSGTLALLKDKGFNIVIATMTPGGMGGISQSEEKTAEIRIKEAAEAADILNAKYYCLDQRDGYVFDNTEARIKVTALVQKVKADVVFTHLPFDYHPDHRATCSIVEAGTILATLPNIPTGETPVNSTPLLYHTSPFNFTDTLGRDVAEPSFFIDITETFEKKIEMLSKHQSQKELMKLMFKMDDFFGDMRNFDRKLGAMVKVPYAEAYWQHLGGGFQQEPLIQNVLKEFRRDI